MKMRSSPPMEKRNKFIRKVNMDRGEGHTRYPLTGEGAATVFVIDEATHNIHVTKSLGQEGKAQYVLLAQAVDQTTK